MAYHDTANGYASYPILESECCAKPRYLLRNNTSGVFVKQYYFFCVALLTTITANATGEIAKKTVFIQQPEVCSTETTGETRQLTSDGIFKWCPRWSPDGKRIAFMSGADRGDSLGHLKIISEDGSLQRDIPIRPKGNNAVDSLRLVEGMIWMADDRILIYGRANPSTVEYAVVDVKSGKETGAYRCDGYSLAISPDGNHAACWGLVRHQGRDSLEFQSLEVDRKSVFPPENVFVDLLTKPVWSGMSNAVAIIYSYLNGPEPAIQEGWPQDHHVAVWTADAGAATYALPEGLFAADVQLLWDADNLFLLKDEVIYRLDSKSHPPAWIRLAAQSAIYSTMKESFDSVVDESPNSNRDVWPKR
jgi:dipeptidyl aminopeptidase/acylaminoacyl peptidase